MTQVSDDRRRRTVRLLAYVVLGVVMVALAAVAVVRLFVTASEEPSETASVQQVADLAVTVTEELDIVSGVGLLCDRPIDLYRMAVESTITRWQSLSGTQVPEVAADVSDVDEGVSGSFVLAISSPEEGLEDEQRTFRVFVEERDGRSCITGVGGPSAERPTTRFAGDGYTGVTSPPPVPTRPPTPEPTQEPTP